MQQGLRRQLQPLQLGVVLIFSERYGTQQAQAERQSSETMTKAWAVHQAMSSSSLPLVSRMKNSTRKNEMAAAVA